MKAEHHNIFIAHTPLQNFISSKIVAQFFSNERYKNWLFTSVDTVDENVFDEKKLIDKKRNFNKIIDTFRAKRHINKIVKSKNTSIYIPHTGALLDNYFFYSFQSVNVDLNFYYEGILYFYEYKEPSNKSEHKKRKMYGKLCGMQYVQKPNIFPHNDSRINKIFSILPKFTLGPKDKIVGVSILKENYQANKKALMIMGGKPSLLENDEVIILYKEMIEEIKQFDNIDTVYFKGHHADNSNNFLKAIDKSFTFEDITQDRPVEEVVEEYNPCHIWSYPSSGLINLKAMYGEKIEMTSLYIKDKKSQIEKLRPIFEELNIKLKLI